jgi:hypothetical protein
VKLRLPLLASLLAGMACGGSDPSAGVPLPVDTPADRFWALVESARAGGTGCSGVARRLTDTLATLPPATIQEFGNELSTRLAESYRWDLWAVAYVAKGGASDDAFDYFRGWLLTRGRRQFEQALRDAPSAVAGAPRFGTLECEAILGVAHDAYQRVARQPLPRSTIPWPNAPAGKPWTEESIEQVYPGLTARVERR